MSRSASTSMAKPKLITTRDALRGELAAYRAGKASIGLVPTMGALHQGHLSLVRQSVAKCDRTIVTVFVNPTQFGPREDFSKYPRTLETDLAALATEKADLVFAPAADEIYPPGFSTYVEPPKLAETLEGQCRPGHFRGVATIVLKLFLLVPADVAFFGHKDFQQARVIQQMVRDLNVDIEVEICPTVREPDGLAMSSRNRYLSKNERQQALAISKSLRLASDLFQAGELDAQEICNQMRHCLSASNIEKIDYVALVDPDTLESVREVSESTIALVAAHVGNTRLIDNSRIG
jgi:pantoate--beta-alanine ligase